MPRKPTVRARGLGAELKELRLKSGLNTREAGQRAGWSHTMVSRIEVGKRGVTTEEIATLLAIYEVTGEHRDRLIDLAREAHRPGWWESSTSSLPSQLTALIGFESQATSITDVALNLVPGLLQTQGYARATISAGGIAGSVMETRVATRIGRQSILSAGNGLRYEAFIDEAVIRRPIGAPGVMTEQIRHLAAMAEQEGTTIRVLPLSLRGHAAMTGSFTVLRFPKAQTLVHIEHRRSSLFLDAPDTVDGFLGDIATLQTTALHPAESADFLRDAVESTEEQ
ncbi:helix-turn-helix transcriptional regulator [Streptomonospora sediminis]